MRYWPYLLIALVLLATCTPVEDPLSKQAALYESIVWPEPPQAARIQLRGTFGKPADLGIKPSILGRLWDWIAGTEPTHMVRPYGIAAAGERVAVADPGAGAVHLYDFSKRRYTRVDWTGSERLVSPVSVAFLDGSLYVADSALERVFVFNARGDHIRTMEGFGRPTGLAVDANTGRLYVADTPNHRIVVMDKAGKKLFQFGRRGTHDGEFNYPSHLTLAGGKLYVNDTMNFRLQIFDLDGNFLSAFGSHGDGSGDFAQPKGLGLDSEGNIYVVDALFNRVQIFDPQGNLLLVFGDDGAAPGEFWLPSGIFIENNNIYVADSYNRRIQIFKFLGGA